MTLPARTLRDPALPPGVGALVIASTMGEVGLRPVVTGERGVVMTLPLSTRRIQPPPGGWHNRFLWSAALLPGPYALRLWDGGATHAVRVEAGMVTEVDLDGARDATPPAPYATIIPGVTTDGRPHHAPSDRLGANAVGFSPGAPIPSGVLGRTAGGRRVGYIRRDYAHPSDGSLAGIMAAGSMVGQVVPELTVFEPGVVAVFDPARGMIVGRVTPEQFSDIARTWRPILPDGTEAST